MIKNHSTLGTMIQSDQGLFTFLLIGSYLKLGLLLVCDVLQTLMTAMLLLLLENAVEIDLPLY